MIDQEIRNSGKLGLLMRNTGGLEWFGSSERDAMWFLKTALWLYEKRQRATELAAATNFRRPEGGG